MLWRGRNLINAQLSLLSARLKYLSAQAKLRTAPPVGDVWIHEEKFDGWRIQVHKFLDTIALYTKGGHHVAERVKSLAEAIAQLPILSFIMDGEVAACDDQGIPDFRTLHFRNDRGEAPVHLGF
jgi:bifunctional non-homologous end joining protein LigD